MIIGGLQKFSLLDYPGLMSAIIFTKGCNFRCHFCYNPMLVWPDNGGRKLKYSLSHKSEKKEKDHFKVDENGLFLFLKERAGKLDAVVITGGEPTIHNDLPEFIKKIKDLGYLIKLDTNGTNPDMLKVLIKEGLIDYIAMDIKGSLENYKKITGVEVDIEKIKKSIKLIMDSGKKIPYEFRTTIMPDLLDKDDIEEIAKIIEGAQRWYLQNFKSNLDLVNMEFKGKKAYNNKRMNILRDIALKYINICELR